jgi:signal transduction histidine kinase
MLSCTALLVFLVDPKEAGTPGELAYMLLISYCLYSACFVLIHDLDQFRELAAHRAAHWIDVVFFSCLIGLTGGSDSIFYFFYFLPILVAAFSWGFREGMRVTFVSAILFTLAGLISISAQHPYDLGEAVLRPVTLVSFGYMIAYFGKERVILKRRLALLQEISTYWNPRFGTNHAIMINLGRLVEFYRGNRGILVRNEAEPTQKYRMFVRERNKPDMPEAPQTISESTATALLCLPDSLAVAYRSAASPGIGKGGRYVAYDTQSREPVDQYREECETLSNLFDESSFISVPYKQQGTVSGRIFLLTDKPSIGRSDVFFTEQVARTLTSVVENMQLIESLIEEAGGRERHRISLDVHDTTIQPYIALTLALDALSREFKDNKSLTARLTEIIDMANMTVQDLRSYKDNLREKSLMRGGFLVTAIKNKADRLLRFYGIHIDVIGNVSPNLEGQIAESAYQIICEGVSNIMRHTLAKIAFVSIETDDTHLLIEIGNETHAPSRLKHFKPKSISERALSMNGETLVETNARGYTVVRVKIPLAQGRI